MGRRSLVLASLVLVMAGCAGEAKRPDLGLLYGAPEIESRRAKPVLKEPPPLVVVPGLLGSRLARPGGEEYWPGSTLALAFSDFPELALSPAPNAVQLRPDGITETAVGRDFYGALLRTLSDFGGYERVEPGTPMVDRSRRRMYVFDYDWRQDNVVTAQAFDRFLAAIRQDYEPADGAATGPDAAPLAVDVVAHSMGGLMVRYYARFGTQDVLDSNRLKVTWAGAPYLNKVVLLGTPNLGSVSAIASFMEGRKVGLGRIPIEVLATMPSAYQLFPHRIIDWLYQPDGTPVDLDQFDVSTWRDRSWSVFNPRVEARVRKQFGNSYLQELQGRFARYAERARRFSWSLTVCPNYEESDMGCSGEVAEPPLRYVVFGGNCAATPARFVLEGNSGKPADLRLTPNAVQASVPRRLRQRLMLDPGDGVVTKPSLLGRDALEPYTPRHQFSYFPLAYTFLLCEEHDALTNNVSFRDNLLDVLLTQSKPWELHKDHAVDGS